MTPPSSTSFNEDITSGAGGRPARSATDALASLEEDFAEGRCVLVDVLWRATLQRAEGISRAQSARLGCRTLDVLHVATALELGLRSIVTFDRRQQQLARDVGLRVVAPGA
jgi:predicted nucleic acid-binding protein